jgi:hypothetical protein
MRMALFGWFLLIKALAPQLALIAIGVVVYRKTDNGALIAQTFRRAMDIAGYSVKAWAIDLGYSNHAHCARMLDGEKPLNNEHIAVAPALVRQWFALLLARQYGIPAEAQIATQIERTV